MKITQFLILASAFATSSYAQKVHNKDVPEIVKNNFQKQFPGAKDAKWEKEGSNFEAEFDLNKTEQSVVFDDQGNLLETEVEINVDQLPKTVVEYIATNYKGQKIKETSKITDAKGIVTYEAEVKDRDLIFDSKGSFIKVEKDAHDEKNEKD